jgi:hypothetical protein
MRLSYAMTFGAVTLRLQIPIGLALGYPGYPEMSVWLAYTSWIPNVIAVLIYSREELGTVVGTSFRNWPFAKPGAGGNLAGMNREMQ